MCVYHLQRTSRVGSGSIPDIGNLVLVEIRQKGVGNIEIEQTVKFELKVSQYVLVG